jgi:glycosyltransferase involved in cell wall biosynthesis
VNHLRYLNNPPRVLVVHPAMAPYRLDLFNALHKRIPLRVLFTQPLPAYDSNLDRHALQDALHCDYGFLEENGSPSFGSLVWRMWKEVRRCRPDVIVTHEFSQASSAASAMSRVWNRRVSHVVWTTKNPLEIAAVRGIRLRAMRWLAATAAAVMTYSAEAADDLSNTAQVPRDRFFVCANHQDPVRLRSLALKSLPTVLADCRRLDILHRQVVVVVSRLAEEKNVSATIAAFRRAFADDGEVCLVIIGEGPLRAALRDSASRMPCGDRIHFLGQQGIPVVQAWLSVASLSVLASSHEPYGAVVGESLIQGTPVLCSEAAGAASLIDSPSKGAVFPPGRIDLLAGMLKCHRSAFVPVEQLAARTKASIPTLTVADDVAGFVAAVSYAARGCHG